MKRVLVVAVMALAVATGCASSDSEAPVTPSGTAGVAPATAQPPSAEPASPIPSAPGVESPPVAPVEAPTTPVAVPEPSDVQPWSEPVPQGPAEQEFVPLAPSGPPVADEVEITCDTPCTTTGCEQYKFSVLGCP